MMQKIKKSPAQLRAIFFIYLVVSVVCIENSKSSSHLTGGGEKGEKIQRKGNRKMIYRFR